MGLFDFLKNSLKLLINEPKLFLPKLFVALFYSMLLLATSYLLITNSALLISMAQHEPITTEQLNHAIFVALAFLALFAISIVAFIFDILVNAMYPFLVNDFYTGKKLSLWSAFRKALRSTPRILPASFGIFLLISIPVSFAVNYIGLSSTNLASQSFSIVILLFLGAFILTLLFYFLYPSILLENDRVLNCIKHNFVLVKRNMRTVTAATLIPFIATLISFVFAIVSVFAPYFLIVFFSYRVISACLFTYHMVLNPVIYLEVRRNE